MSIPLLEAWKEKTTSIGASLDENQVRGTRRLGMVTANEISRAGFTLVEVIIVLAIVGLIFVIIFLAVAAAQRGQRDTARRDNVNRMFATIQQVAGNNNGVAPLVATPTAGSCPTCAWTAVASGTAAGWTFSVNSPVTAITGGGAPNAAGTSLGWGTQAQTGCAAVTGTSTYVGVILDDGVTRYCKSY